MNSYQLIYQLIDLVEQMGEENPGREVSMRDFMGFLLTKHGAFADGPPGNEARFGKQDERALEMAAQLDNTIGRQFVFMSRYAKYYIRKALEDSPLQSSEEFTALAILLTHPHLSKSELIAHNLQEKTSGTEVIRRLILSGLVRQWEGVLDKRSKHIAITDEGKALMYRLFADISHASNVITGDLTVAEKMTLQYLLQKLEGFHLDHYLKKTILTKEDLRNFKSNIV